MKKPKFNTVKRSDIGTRFSEMSINICVHVLNDKAEFDENYNVTDFRYSLSSKEFFLYFNNSQTFQ